jgi:hypothetical protein
VRILPASHRACVLARLKNAYKGVIQPACRLLLGLRHSDAGILGYQLRDHHQAMPRSDSNLGPMSGAMTSSEEFITMDRESLGVVRVIVGFLQGPQHLLQFSEPGIPCAFRVAQSGSAFHRDSARGMCRWDESAP